MWAPDDPRVEDILLAELAQAEEELIEPEPAQLPTEPELIPPPEEPTPESPLPEASVFVVDEPGLTELAPAPILSSSSNLKVMGIILIIFSFLAWCFLFFKSSKATCHGWCFGANPGNADWICFSVGCPEAVVL